VAALRYDPFLHMDPPVSVELRVNSLDLTLVFERGCGPVVVASLDT
jgi:hypothetical protein